MPETRVPIPAPRPQHEYSHSATGSWGEFGDPERDRHHVLYLSAHVRVQSDSPGERNDLVESLAPVREVLDTRQLKFSELLQRDLEDHRVLRKLIPYLMDGVSANDPRVNFFPPLLAVLLPFENERPGRFSALETGTETITQSSLKQQVIESPGYFKFGRTTYEDGQLVRTQRTATLSWNPNTTRLVVIDGQHRAMALLALYRTIHGRKNWPNNADRYKHFYIDEVLKQYGDRPLPKVEVPVTICVFPGLVGGDGREVHNAARRLFVDVNKEAKTPNHSRLILLSETNLTSIFARSLLDELREAQESRDGRNFLPLSAVEFDTPGAQSSMDSLRKVCVTDLVKLEQIVNVVVRATAFTKDYASVPGRGQIGRDESMRKQLFDAGKVFELKGPDGKTFELKDLKEEEFPSWATEEIRESFLARHGRHLLRIFSQVLPYSIFRDRIIQLEEDWAVVADAVSSLSKEALLDGVGTYWTLRDFDREWKEQLRKLPDDAREQRKDAPPMAVKGWEIVQAKEAEFETLLSRSIWSFPNKPDDSEDISRELQKRRQVSVATEGVLGRARTSAVQQGLAAAYAGLVINLKVSPDRRDEFTSAFINRMNDVLSSVSSRGFRRLFIFSSESPNKSSDERFYLFHKTLNPNRWPHMRWIWLEIFFCKQVEFKNVLTDLVSQDDLDRERKVFVQIGRERYLSTLQSEAVTNLRSDASESEKATARDAMRMKARKAYLNWFDEDIEETARHKPTLDAAPQVGQYVIEADDGEGGEDDPEEDL